MENIYLPEMAISFIFLSVQVNRAYLPHTVPFSFHGNWFPGLH